MIATLPILLSLLVPPQFQDPAQTGFTRDLASAERLAARGDWVGVRSILARLLHAHEDQDYVRARRTDIRELHRRATYHLTTTPPDPRTLVDGEMSVVDLRSGRVKVTYASWPVDFTEIDGRMQHNARFRLPLTVTLRGGTQDQDLDFGVFDGDRFVRLQCRKGEAPTLETSDGQGTLLGPARPLPVGRPFQIGIRVQAGALIATIDQEPWFRATFRKAPVSGGSVALKVAGIDQLVMDGHAEPAWLQSLIDDAVQQAMHSFDEDRVPLPEWLSRPTLSTGVEVHLEDDHPTDVLDAAQIGLLDHCEQLLEEGAARSALAFLDGLSPVQLPEATETALRVSVLLHLGRHQEALQAVDRLLDLAPESLHTRKLRADVMVALGRKDDAQVLWRSMVDERPGRADFYVEAASALLAFGDTEGARHWVDLALYRKVASTELHSIHRILIQAERGPDWQKAYRFQSRRFLVGSDMDLETCRQVSRVLEDSLRLFRGVLDPLDPDSTTPFRVYVFSGKSGYQRYARALFGRALPAHTEGYYSPMLQQTLVWNLHSRAQMLRVVRHEAFHHYLDHRMRHPPVWLDEGFAEYFMDAERGPTGDLLGVHREDHLTTLRTLGMVPLADFVALDPSGFRADPKRHYAQAYAFCHFLRHGGEEAGSAFARLWQMLVEGRSATEVIEEVFDPDALSILGPLFESHVEGM